MSTCSWRQERGGALTNTGLKILGAEDVSRCDECDECVNACMYDRDREKTIRERS